MIAVYCRRVGKEGEEDSAQEEGVEGRWGRPHFEGDWVGRGNTNLQEEEERCKWNRQGV